MSTKRDGKGRRRLAIRRGFSVESLERRALLATVTETFTGPSLAGLIAQAERGHDTSSVGINRMLNALQSQLESGPLADLNSGAVDGNGFIVEVQGLEASFEADVDTQLYPKFPNVDELLKLQGQGVVANLTSLNQQESAGLISSVTLASSSLTTIDAITAGPIHPLGTTLAGVSSVTKAFKAELSTLLADVNSSTTPLGLLAANTTLNAEAEAYRAYVHAGIQMTQLRISGEADAAINALESTSNTIGQTLPADGAGQLASAINTFDAAVYDTTGLFGPKGAFSKAKKVNLRPGQTNGQAASQLISVSATTTLSGVATPTATLTEADGSPIQGESVTFTVGGAYAGVGITNFKGVAIASGVATTAAVGTDTGAVVAYFASNTNFLAARGTGDLVVSKATTSLSAVSGTASFGDTATLTATLKSSATSLGLAGETVSFTLDGAAVGTAVTDSSGVATLAGATTSDSAGVNTGVIVATFAGDTTNAATSASGNLTVAQASAALSSVSATAAFGGPVTLKATLASPSGVGIAGQTVNFVLDNIIVGTGVTDSTGLATLTGVSTGDAVGTDAGGVIATFAGSTNYAAAANATGDLVVTQAGTTVDSVSGSAAFGGPATLVATLTSSVTNASIAGQTISFNLDGKIVGTAVTNGSGIATLTGVATSDAAGTDSAGLFATFEGSTNFAGSTGTGNLVVSTAASTLADVGGTASFGGTATLVATLTSSVTNAALVGETVSFTLGGNSVGTAVTDASGVATLTGVAQSFAVGTDTGGVVASFAGDTDYASSSVVGNLVVSQAGTSVTAVSGTAPLGGPATLMATLKSSVTSLGVAGETVNFTLNGTAVGGAITDSNGIATLTGVATAANSGLDAGAVVATFAGDTSYINSSGTGDLTVGQVATTLSGAAGTASFGGKATLSATLKATSTSVGVAGETVSFTLDGTVVGTAITDSNGIATLTGVTTADAVGTHTGAVVASFAGDTNHSAAANDTGDLVVSQATTTTTVVGGTASFGGTATLTATLTSSVTSQPISGETVTFTLDGTSVGTAITNAAGVATLAGVATSDPVGTDSGGVVASFAGDTSYTASTGTGDLVVSQASTTVSAVAGTSSFGGTATLTATLDSSVTTQGIAGQTISFTLDGTVVGTAVTNSSGVATLTGVTNADAVGTHNGAVLASYAATTDYTASSGTGDLVVSQAGTTVAGVSGTAPVGGPATLMATLTSVVTGLPLAGETVEFALDGTAVGSAVTDASGVATLTGVPTSDPAGTDPGGIVAVFPGDPDYTTSTGTGNLTVS